MNKFVIVVKDGAVVEVYADHPSNYDAEVIDFDTQDSDVRAAAEERLYFTYGNKPDISLINRFKTEKNALCS